MYGSVIVDGDCTDDDGGSGSGDSTCSLIF